jgi:hypothetical protein
MLWKDLKFHVMEACIVRLLPMLADPVDLHRRQGAIEAIYILTQRYG